MATYYVATNGNDTVSKASNSLQSPWKTPTLAVDKLTAGDTLYIRGGYYAMPNGSRRMLINKNNITISAYNNETVTIDGRCEWYTAWRPNPTDNTPGHDIKSNPVNTGVFDAIFDIENASGVTVRGIIVENSAGEGLRVTNSPNAVIDKMTYNYTNGSGMQFYTDSDGSIATDCVSYKASQKGSTHAMGARYCHNITYLRCTVSHYLGEGMSFARCHDSLIKDCVVFNGNKVGFYNGVGTGNTFDGCLAYTTGDIEGVRGTPPVGMKITAEVDNGTDNVTENITVKNCLIVGHSPNFLIAGGQDGAKLNPYWGMRGLKVFNNTFVDAVATGGQDYNVGIYNKYAENNSQNTTCWFVNNLIVQRDGLPVLNLNGATQYDKWIVKNNVWSSAPNSRFRGDTDIVGNAGLARPHKDLVHASDMDVRDYKIVQGSAAINAGTTAYSGVVAVPDDYFDSTRNVGKPDAGFHEFGASGGPAEDYITANFSGTPTSGAVPLTVAFTNSSTATKTIATSAWNFGDGDTRNVNGTGAVSHVYTTPGTYTVTLTVIDANGLTDTKQIADYITVNSAGGGDNAGNVAYRVASFAASTTASVQTVAHGCSETPKAIIFAPSLGKVAGTPVADALLSFGGAASSGQFATAIWADDGQDTSRTRRYQSNNRAIALIVNDTTYTAAVTWDATDMTLTWDAPPPEACLIAYMAIGGASVSASVATTAIGAKDMMSTIDVGFAPTVVLTATDYDSIINRKSYNGLMSIGAIRADDKSGVSVRYSNNKGTTESKAYISSNRVGYDLLSSPASQIGGYLTGSGYTLTPREADANYSVAGLALKIDGPAFYAALVNSPTATGNTDNTAPAASLGALLTIATAAQTTDTLIDTADAGTAGISFYDGTNERTVSAADEDGEGTSDSQSLAANSLIVPDDNGDTLFVGATTFVTNGYRRNMSSTNGTARKWLVLGFGATSTKPIPGFSITPTSGNISTVFQVTSSANANGLGAMTYDYNWGDGSAHATTANPTHTYAAAGTYTITQTVTAGGQSATFTVDVVVVGAGAEAAWTITGAPGGYVPVGGQVTVTANVTPASGKTITNYAWLLYTGSTTGNTRVQVYAISGASITSISRIMATEGTFGLQLAVTQSDGQITTVYDDNALNVSRLPAPVFAVQLIGQGTVAADGKIEAQLPATVRLTDASDGGGHDITGRVYTITNSAGAVVDTITGKANVDYTFAAYDTYSISLAITTAAGTATATKTNIVTVPYGQLDIIGPAYPAKIDTWTANQVQGDYTHTHAIESTTEADPNTVVATDTRGGTRLNYLSVGAPLDVLYNSAARPVMRVKGWTEYAGPESGIAGNSIKVKANTLEPYAPYSVDLGNQANKWGGIYGANLLVETLVAADVKADIGGRVVIGSTNTIEREIKASDGRYITIRLKYDTGMGRNDFYWFEGQGKFEIMKLTSTPVAVDVDEDTVVYEASATRETMDANGAHVLHDWPAGTACINTGGLKYSDGTTIPVGWIDLYARNSMNTDSETLDGPTIVGNVRWASGPDDWAATYALGNLRGRYGQGDSNTWGVAVGWDRDSTAYMVALSDAITFYGAGRTPIMRFNATNGLEFVDSDDGIVTNKSVQWVDSDKNLLTYLGAGKLINGGSSSYLYTQATTDNYAELVIRAYSPLVGTGDSKVFIVADGPHGDPSITIDSNSSYQTVVLSGLPTSSSGLPSGALWNNSGVINIVT